MTERGCLALCSQKFCLNKFDSLANKLIEKAYLHKSIFLINDFHERKRLYDRKRFRKSKLKSDKWSKVFFITFSIDTDYLSEFTNLKFANLPGGELKKEESEEKVKTSPDKEEALKKQIRHLQDELGTIKGYISEKMQKQVKKTCLPCPTLKLFRPRHGKFYSQKSRN